MNNKRNFFSLLLCFVPGAVHLYLGMKKMGVQLMALFFLPMYLTSFFRIDAFLFFLPLIWCYSFFDGLRKRNGEDEVNDEGLEIFQWLQGSIVWNYKKHRMVGYGLIGAGLIITFQRIIMPLVGTYLSWEIRQYIEVGLLAMLLIAGGFYLLAGGKGEEEPQWEEGE